MATSALSTGDGLRRPEWSAVGTAHGRRPPHRPWSYSTPTLLRLLTSHQIDARRFITHHFGFDEFVHAYDVFARAGETGALKIVLSRNN
jgi:threonine dehydrogenase-like Zn-dependent dehydrogenase